MGLPIWSETIGFAASTVAAAEGGLSVEAKAGPVVGGTVVAGLGGGLSITWAAVGTGGETAGEKVVVNGKGAKTGLGES